MIVNDVAGHSEGARQLRADVPFRPCDAERLRSQVARGPFALSNAASGTEPMVGETLLLDRSAVRAAVEADTLAEELGKGLRTYAGTGNPHRVRAPLTAGLTAMVLVPGLASGVPAYTVKVHAKDPTAHEPIRGLLLLHDLPTGHLLAVMDSGWLTAQRTALSAAYVHDHFTARRIDGRVAVIGAGAQGATTARALQRLQPSSRFAINDVDIGRSVALRDALGPQVAKVSTTPELALEGRPRQ